MDRRELERELEELHAASFAWALVCCDDQRANAEDVLQNAYLKVLDGRARFGGRSTLRTWLFGVIRLTALQERRGLRLRWPRNGHLAAEPVDPGPLADRALEQAERSARLGAALATLPRRQREVLELVFYHGLTIDESSAVMDVRPGTARTHYERGKKNLLRRLGGGEDL